MNFILVWVLPVLAMFWAVGMVAVFATTLAGDDPVWLGRRVVAGTVAMTVLLGFLAVYGPQIGT